MIDIHSHILPGLDDGAADLDESLAMARLMVEDGVRVVVATPHVREDFPTTPAQMDEALTQVRATVAAAGLPLTILPGGELSLEALGRLDANDRAAFGLGGRPTLLLVETPYHGWSAALSDAVTNLVANGITPIVAHPERNPSVQERPALLQPLVDAGSYVQLTSASLDGAFGRRAKATAHALLERGLAHVVASDMHTPGARRRMRSVEASLGTALARWATHDVPAALIAGEPVPGTPGVSAPRGRRLGAWSSSRGR
jgi:protein-tyrosine phosphatase